MSFSLHSPFVSIGHFHCHNHQNHISPPSTTTTTLASPPYLFQQRRKTRSVLTLSSESMEICGVDSEGKEFNSAQEMWREEIGEEGDETRKTQWYRDGVSYWEGVEASVDGVLGGYGHVNDADIIGSEVFLKTLLQERLVNVGANQHLVALDCGSGIGRITKNLLIRYFNEVDLLEPVAQFLDAARENLASAGSETHKATNFFCVPLQEFTPAAGRYDVIWVQWCIGHLTDNDFVSFFNRAKGCLKPGGFFIVKENLAKNGFVLDKEDHSITRSDPYFKQLFRQCGLHLYRTKDQKGLPQELFAVKMYALTVDTPPKIHRTRSKTTSNRPQIIK
ncbi:Alpha-N-methyltransferase NTM1 [Arabidopsis suecica]|uniref:Alpha-N-methyltransferase NTM1 n=1 Tax=Arabidopsis suecica TaxID=45249 RepID=A0A8T1XX45_ARASU|nr:Alpha-N-methyltransferase NTM1 [Arabidopsis suecica]